MIGPLIRRDMTLALRTPAGWLLGLMFFAVFLLLCAIALGGTFTRLQLLGPALIWLAAIFSQLLTFNTLFQSDFGDGSIEQYIVAGISPLMIVVSKAAVFFIYTFLPLLLAVPLAGLGFGLETPVIIGTCLSLLFAAPALTAYGVMSGAVLAGRPQGGFVSVLMTAPFLIPILIFGVAAIDSYPVHGLSGLEFQALAGLSLIGCAAGLPAASAALSANLE